MRLAVLAAKLLGISFFVACAAGLVGLFLVGRLGIPASVSVVVGYGAAALAIPGFFGLIVRFTTKRSGVGVALLTAVAIAFPCGYAARGPQGGGLVGGLIMVAVVASATGFIGFVAWLIWRMGKP